MICEAGFRCTSIVTDACCPSTATGAKCALPRTHLIAYYYYPSLLSRSKTIHKHTHGHTQARGMPRSLVFKYPCQVDYTAVVTHRWRKRSASPVQRHAHAWQCASAYRDSHANAGAPCDHTRTRMHAVAPAARALSSCARRSMAWQLQLSISTMLAMAHILLTTRDTSVTTTVRKRAAHELCLRLRMRTPAE